MTTSPNELREIEDFLLEKMKPEDAFAFKAKLLLNPTLRAHTELQRTVYRLVKHYGRKKLRSEIEVVHSKLFQEPDHLSFREKIYRLFANS